MAPEEAPTEEGSAEEAAVADDPMATEDGVAYASLTGDASAGKRVFAQCRTCHVTDPGVNRIGPSLAGIVGSKAGAVDGFNYSPANANSGITWTEEQMYVYLEDPQRAIPKTKMIYAGLPDAQQRADVIAYLKDPS
ncbi:MAG: c-type cytochrome [Pseudomonadota bacterium]